MIKIKKKWLRRTLWIFSIFVVLLTIFVFFFLEGIVIKKLEEKLENSYGQTYNITYKDLNYNLFFTSLTLELVDVKIKTDTIKAKERKSPVINMESKSIKLSDISLWKFFASSEMNVKNIVIDEPHVSIAKNKDFDSEKESSSSDAKLDISEHIKSIKFDEFTIKKGSAVFYDDMQMTDTLFVLKDMDFEAQEFESNHNNLSELLIIDKYKSLNIESKSFSFDLGEDNYDIYVKKFKGDLIKGNFELNDIHFKPPFDKLMIGKEYRGDVKVTKLDLYGVEHVKGEKIDLSADSAIIIDTHIDLTKNQALSKQRDKVLWMESVLSLNGELAIKNLKFRNCSFTNEIQKLDGDKKYNLKLTNLNGSINNINTNSESENLTIELHSNVFKTGELKLSVLLPYDNPKVSFYEGTISNIDLKSFNDLIVKMYSLKIEKGKLNKLTFKGKTYDNECKGKLTFEYDDLEGSLIKERNGKKKTAKLISKLMNLFIHSSNPREGETIPEEVIFAFTKEKHHGQIMLWLGGIIDGTVLTIIGKKKHDFLLTQIDN